MDVFRRSESPSKFVLPESVIEIAHSMDDFAEKLIHGRVHVSPKRLDNPGPDVGQKKQILLAANAAPDHGRMMPWRFIEIGQSSRNALGEVFHQCLLDRDQNATPIQLQEAREKALRGPLLLLAIVNYEDSTNEISKEEKLVSLGCAIQNILLSAYALGFGSGLSSGKALQSPRLRNLFNLTDHEDPICFITIGTVTQNKPGRIRPSVSDYHSIF
jgi:nitroreductase